MELDVAVVGRHVYILANVGKSVEVSPFTPANKPIEAKAVYAAVQYQCRFCGNDYIFVIRDAIYMSLMANSLIPPFMLQEAGVQVNERAKIHAYSLTTFDIH